MNTCQVIISRGHFSLLSWLDEKPSLQHLVKLVNKEKKEVVWKFKVKIMVVSLPKWKNVLEKWKVVKESYRIYKHSIYTKNIYPWSKIQHYSDLGLFQW